MKRIFAFWCLLSSCLLRAGSAFEVEARLLHEQTMVSQGHTFWLAAQITLPSSMRTAWCLPIAEWPATRVRLQLPSYLSVRSLHWPLPKIERVGTQVRAFYEGQFQLLIEVAWRNVSERQKRMEALLEIEGQMQGAGQVQNYFLSHSATLPSLRLPGEVPPPQDPLLLQTFKQARRALPAVIDPALVTWSYYKEGIQLQIQGLQLESLVDWLALPYSLRSDLLPGPVAPAVVLKHARSGEFDLLSLSIETLRAWMSQGVEQILLVDEQGRQGWILWLDSEMAGRLQDRQECAAQELNAAPLE